MEASSTSVAAFTLSLAAIALLVLLLLRHYLPLRKTPGYLLVPVFLSLFLPCSIILLVPIDVASSAVEEDGRPRGIWLPSGAMLYIWRIAYWLTFVLTWAILPILGEYSDSGAREPRDRLRYSLRANAKYHIISLTLGIAGLVYIFLQSGFAGTNVKALLMALAYAWGLILAIYLMGHGLVALPRRLFKGASVAGQLRQLHAAAPGIHDKMQGSMDRLEDLEATLRDLQRNKRPGMTKDMQEWLADLSAPTDIVPTRLGPRASNPTPLSIPAVVTERYLSDLARKLKRARHARIRFVEEWTLLVDAATKTQTILDAASTRSLTFSSKSRLHLSPRVNYHLHAQVLPISRLLLAILLGLASIGVLYSEVAKAIAPAYSMISLTVIHHPSATDAGKIGLAGQAISSFWLLYMCAAALTSMREVRVWGNRALVPRHTYAESATWYACQVAKLTVPLSYNFVTLLPRDISHNTTFYKFLGQLIDLTPLGTGFSRFFPVLIVLPVLATLLGWYGKVQRIFGFGAMEDETDDDAGWNEGRALIQREVLAGGSSNVGLRTRDASPTTASPVDRPGLGGRYSDFPETLPTTGSIADERPIRTAGQARRDAAQATQDDAGLAEDSNWFGDFAHRVRNTFETVGQERPGFAVRLPDRPKWLGGAGAGSGSGSGVGTASGSGAGAPSDGRPGGNFFGKLFGDRQGSGGGGVGGGLRL